jgi:transposase
VRASSVGLHLKKLKLSYQKPEYQDAARDRQEIEHFLNDKFPRSSRSETPGQSRYNAR